MSSAERNDSTRDPTREEPRRIFQRRTNSKATISADLTFWHDEPFVMIQRVARDGSENRLTLWWPDVIAIVRAVAAAIKERGEAP